MLFWISLKNKPDILRMRLCVLYEKKFRIIHFQSMRENNFFIANHRLLNVIMFIKSKFDTYTDKNFSYNIKLMKIGSVVFTNSLS